MPLFRSSRKAQAQVAGASTVKPALRNRDVIQQQPRIPSPERRPGRWTSETIQRQSVQLSPAIKPPYIKLDSTRKEIRLLKIYPGRSSDAIRCHLFHTFLGAKDMVAYETVSYCWGPPSTSVIEIDRLPVIVTKSAKRLIHRVRYPDKERIIWIDAICIDQSDLTERSEQIAFMSDVYSCTWRNLVWLGSDRGHATAVEKTLIELLANIRSKTSDLSAFYSTIHSKGRPGDNNVMNRDGNLMDRKINIDPLIQLFSSPWFGRLWVAQEVALPPANLCMYGPATFQLSSVLRAAVWLWHNASATPTRVSNVAGTHYATKLWYLADHECVPKDVYRRSVGSLASVFHFLRDFEATVHKDKVYALLGLFLHTRPEAAEYMLHLKPDYRRTDAEVFREATRMIMEESRSLIVLQHRIAYAQPVQLEPSWAVPFNKMARFTLEEPRSVGHHWNAHDSLMLKDTTYDINVSWGTPTYIDSLILHGFQLDEITVHTEQVPDWEDRYIFPVLQEAVDMTESLRKISPGRDMTTELGYTLMSGGDWTGAPLTPKTAADFPFFMHYVRRTGKLPPEGLDADMLRYDASTQKAIRCYRSVAHGLLLRRFFITKQGYLAGGPAALQCGDAVVILYGGSVPFIVRSNRNGTYRFIGECYVHGVMHGEAMHAHRARKRSDQIFRLV